MPDITMCTGAGCRQKDLCYRYRATPTPYVQSYFLKPPVTPGGGCVFFWECDESVPEPSPPESNRSSPSSGHSTTSMGSS